MTTFFDVADRAYLPTVVGRADLVRANGALAATSSAVEFAAFGVAGFLVNLLTAPIAIPIDALLVRRLGRAAGHDSASRAAATARVRARARADEILEGLRLVSATRSCAASPGDDGPVGDVGRVRRRRGCCS